MAWVAGSVVEVGVAVAGFTVWRDVQDVACAESLCFVDLDVEEGYGDVVDFCRKFDGRVYCVEVCDEVFQAGSIVFPEEEDVVYVA